MFEKLYKKSEVWFAVILIIAYVVGNSFLIEVSQNVGLEMVFTIPYNLVLLWIMFSFIARNKLSQYYGINRVRCKSGKLLYYVPLVLISTVNIWFGVRLKMVLAATLVYFVAMIITGIVEEMLFRGFLFKAIGKKNMKSAIVITSITFGIGHIVNLFNGNSDNKVETICQVFYALAIGFLLAAVLYMGESIIPCIITHSTLNALSSVSNEAVIDKVQIRVSIVLFVVAAVSAIIIFMNAKKVRNSETNEENING